MSNAVQKSRLVRICKCCVSSFLIMTCNKAESGNLVSILVPNATLFQALLSPALQALCRLIRQCPSLMRDHLTVWCLPAWQCLLQLPAGARREREAIHSLLGKAGSEGVLLPATQELTEVGREGVATRGMAWHGVCLVV